MTDNALEKLRNIVDTNVENYLGMPPIIDRPKSKYRAYGTTTKKRNKDKELKNKKIAEKSRKRNKKRK